MSATSFGSDYLRRQAAEHEAAHAIVADELGFGVGEVRIGDDGGGNTRFHVAEEGQTLGEAAVYLAATVWIGTFRFREYPARAERGCGSDFRKVALLDGYLRQRAAQLAGRILLRRQDDVLAFADHLLDVRRTTWADWKRVQAGGTRAAPMATTRAAATARRQAMRGVGSPHALRGAPGLMVRSADGMARGTAERSVAFPATMRSALVERNGRQMYRVVGYASAFEKPYDMWDAFGPYQESVARGAADVTLATNPDVVFLVNHGGLAMARTTAGTLDLSADAHGLRDTAWLNPERTDVRDLMSAIDDRIVTEQSFAFRITEGWWNDDFTEFKIISFDIDRGDVSAVNYGANPHTEIGARQQTAGRSVAEIESLLLVA